MAYPRTRIWTSTTPSPSVFSHRKADCPFIPASVTAGHQCKHFLLNFFRKWHANMTDSNMDTALYSSFLKPSLDEVFFSLFQSNFPCLHFLFFSVALFFTTLPIAATFNRICVLGFILFTGIYPRIIKPFSYIFIAIVIFFPSFTFNSKH